MPRRSPNSRSRGRVSARRLGLAAALLPLALGLAACAAKRPVLYPNAQLQDDGFEVADREVDRCVAWAEDWVGNRRVRTVARDTAESSVSAAATGAAVGAVVGSAGRGAAAGAAGGAARGVVRGVFGSRDPDPLVRRFVERCLRERGYDTVGWR